MASSTRGRCRPASTPTSRTTVVGGAVGVVQRGRAVLPGVRGTAAGRPWPAHRARPQCPHAGAQQRALDEPAAAGLLPLVQRGEDAGDRRHGRERVAQALHQRGGRLALRGDLGGRCRSARRRRPGRTRRAPRRGRPSRRRCSEQ
jgi:hypothetical protein